MDEICPEFLKALDVIKLSWLTWLNLRSRMSNVYFILVVEHWTMQFFTFTRILEGMGPCISRVGLCLYYR